MPRLSGQTNEWAAKKSHLLVDGRHPEATEAGRRRRRRRIDGGFFANGEREESRGWKRVGRRERAGGERDPGSKQGAGIAAEASVAFPGRRRCRTRERTRERTRDTQTQTPASWFNAP